MDKITTDNGFLEVDGICVMQFNVGDFDTYSSIDGYDCVSQTNSFSCTNEYMSSYSGCGRKVCALADGKKFCDSYSIFGNSNWRLPQISEMGNWYKNYSTGLGRNGLQICDGNTTHTNGYRENLCDDSRDRMQSPAAIMTATPYYYTFDSYYSSWRAHSNNNENLKISVRCVSDL